MSKYLSYFSAVIIALISQSIGPTLEQRLLSTDATLHLDNPENTLRIIGNRQQQKNIIRWLDGISATTKGHETLQSIMHSGHQLTIRHSFAARLSAGRTIAPMTENLINGKGESVEVIIDANMLDSGTHRVFNQHFKMIPFNAQQNLYHELAHAMHKMRGTWRYFNSEQQAIEEENIFRQQLAALEGEYKELRYGKSGVPVESISVAKSNSEDKPEFR